MKYQANDLAAFGRQMKFALGKYQEHNLNPDKFDNIIVAGLGGSGIAARMVKALTQHTLRMPFVVISDYVLPAYADNSSICILSSYSGNTEETLSMYHEAKQRGCALICLSTGGKLIEHAKADNVLYYLAESGFQPRMALGYSLTYLLLIFGELFEKPYPRQLAELSNTFGNHEPYLEKARQLYQAMGAPTQDKVVVVADAYTSAVGLRFCQQVQENAKTEAFLNELPEANHNVIETYYGKLPSTFLMLPSDWHVRTGYRFEFLAELLRGQGNTVAEMPVQTDSLEAYLEAVYVLDWVSLLMADKRGVNSSDIKNINALKSYLEKR